MSVYFKKLHPKAIEPKRYTKGAAGLDLCALLDKPLFMSRGETYKIPTGIALELPPGLMGLIFARSSTALRGFSAEHPPIDSDYRGEIHILGRWHGNGEKGRHFVVEPGQRIAQLLFMIALAPPMYEIEVLGASERGENGFGSTDAMVVDPNADTAVIAQTSDVWPCPICLDKECKGHETPV